MAVKTTFRGGGGKDRDWGSGGGTGGWSEDPSMYEHHYPRVAPAGDGRQVSLQFASSRDVANPAKSPNDKQFRAGTPADPDPWRPFPTGTDTKALGWNS